MSEYYGIAPSSDFFAHYGVKGMKWGVRKAVEKSSRKLDKAYRKAYKKLEKLNKRADVETQAKLAQKYKSAAKGNVGAAVIGASAAGASKLLHPLVEGKAWSAHIKRGNEARAAFDKGWDKYAKGKSNYLNSQAIANEIKSSHGKTLTKEDWDIPRKVMDNWDKERQGLRNTLNKAETDSYNRYSNTLDAMKRTREIGVGIAAAGTGMAVANAIRSHAAKKRTTPEGHAKAVAERNAWQKEMKSAFAGTKYAGLPQQNKGTRYGSHKSKKKR